jgi:GalNAc-alpha-(1->4)-GalNAc-alpha-(1->3)-diNAcBac-PP-undecaprenol alpha-1,4-N-acetyl-D-galactosaminyltransferase
LNKKEKILIINNGLSGGGIERASTSLANYLAEKGYKIIVLALYQEKIVFKLRDDIKFVEPIFNRKFNGRVLYVLKLLKFIRKEVLSHNPNTILSFGEWTNPYVVISLLGLKYPIYLSDRMSPIAKLPFISEILKRLTYPTVSGIIAQTNFAKKIIEKKTGSTRISVIPNPVNIITLSNDIEQNIILSVGRLSLEKGHIYLIKAFYEIRKLNWKLFIIGEGKEKEKLVNLTKSLGLEKQVIFWGYLQDFSKQLTKASIFVLPSLKEGFPNSLIEAMAVGKACISTNYFEGFNEIIQDGINGLLVQPGNVEDLAIAMQKLIKNTELRKGIAFRALEIKNKLSFPLIADQYLEVILPK